MKYPMGASITYAYAEVPNLTNDGYVSFGRYDENTGQDSYGVIDDNIFCYFESLDDLLEQAAEPNKTDWWVVSIESIHYDNGSIEPYEQ